MDPTMRVPLKYLGKVVGDTRDPFLVNQIETLTKERNKERKLKGQYDGEINEIATFLGCYGCSKDIISTIEKYKTTHDDLRNFRMKGKFRFMVFRFFKWFIRQTAW